MPDQVNLILLYARKISANRISRNYDSSNSIITSLSNGTSILLCPFNLNNNNCEECVAPQVLLISPLDRNKCITPNLTTMDVINNIYAKCKTDVQCDESIQVTDPEPTPDPESEIEGNITQK